MKNLTKKLGGKPWV